MPFDLDLLSFKLIKVTLVHFVLYDPPVIFLKVLFTPSNRNLLLIISIFFLLQRLQQQLQTQPGSLPFDDVINFAN